MLDCQIPFVLALSWCPLFDTLPELLEHICLYAYMHKVNPNIFRYFLQFYSCITFISLFAHRSNFFRNFPYFSCHFIHFKSLSFWHGTVNFCFRLSARVPTRRAESNYIIRNARAHLGTLSGVEAGAETGYMRVETPTRIFPPQCSDSHWGGENLLFLFLHCIN